MARTATFQSNTYGPRTLYLRLTQTPDIATNTSRIDWRFSSEGSNSSASLFLVYATTIKINGEQVYYKGDTQWYGTGSPEHPVPVFPAAEGSVSGSVTVSHNADGTLTIPIYFYTGVYASRYKANYGGNWTLDSIPRPGAITAAPNFTDDENPTITYTNPPGNTTEELVAGIYNDAGSVSYAGYRDITKTGTSYTFSLTDAERNALRNATPNSNTMTVRFYMRTKLGGTHYYSSVAKTLTIANPNPTLNPTVVDSNNTTKALTGDANKLVKYFSNAYYTINAGAVKGSSLTSQKVTHNGLSKTTATGTYNAVENGSFAFEAKDSRGNTSTNTITKTMVDYVKLTCNQDIKISTNGTATIKATGNYFNASFGAVANTLTLQYRWKTQDGSWSSWTNLTITKNGNTYTGTASLTGLDYKTNYVFQCKAVDKLMNVSTAELTTKALPVFDWGENSFQFNVPVTFAAGYAASGYEAAGYAAAAVDAMAIGNEEEPIQGDYVIEQGSDGAYAYRKWNSGAMEAWRVSHSPITVKSSKAYGNTYYTDTTTFRTTNGAAQFTVLEHVQVTVNKLGSIGLWQPVLNNTGLTANGEATADVVFVNPLKDAEGAVTLYISFKGRWR